GGWFAGAVADLAGDGGAPVGSGAGCFAVAAPGVHQSDVVQGGRFAGPVADLAGDGQCLLVVVQGVFAVAAPGVHHADVVQGGRFAGPVADLAADGQRLLVVVMQRPVRIPQHALGATGVQQRPAAGLHTARPVGQREDLPEPRHPQPRPGQPVTHLPDNLLDTGGLPQPAHLHQINLAYHTP